MPGFKYTTAFKKDFKRLENDERVTGRLTIVLAALASGKSVPLAFRDHRLVGRLSHCRECHIRPDLLLVYEPASEAIVLHRLCNHGELFRN